MCATFTPQQIGDSGGTGLVFRDIHSGPVEYIAGCPVQLPDDVLGHAVQLAGICGRPRPQTLNSETQTLDPQLWIRNPNSESRNLKKTRGALQTAQPQGRSEDSVTIHCEKKKCVCENITAGYV